MNNNVNLIPNTPDDLHCLQSAYLMLVKFFKPDFTIDWDKWSNITGYEAGKGTWASAGLLWMKDNGFAVKHISLFDYDEFMQHGGEYLTRSFGAEIGEWQVQHSNIPLEQARAKRLVEENIWVKKEPAKDDIKQFLDNGYLLRCMVNAQKLNGKTGYFGHAVVVSGYDEHGFIIQDPGLPPLKNRRVTYEDFEKAWADPNKEAKELDVIKLVER